jgi:hypothetical protein
MFKHNAVEDILGGMSPLQAKSGHSDHGSVSFAGQKPSSSETMSIDSNNTATTQRAPLGELQVCMIALNAPKN